MKIDVITKFKLNPETGRLSSIESHTEELNTNLQLQNVIIVQFMHCKNNQSVKTFRGCFLKSLFDDKDLYYVNNGVHSGYFYLNGDDTKFNTLTATNAVSQPTRYPYAFIPERYNASVQTVRFQLPEEPGVANATTKQLKYTFGIEFETAGGVIPEDQCFALGLVPLRDGSISGIEYATIPLSSRNIGLLKKQIACLKRYTTTDSTCSMHMHFGRLPHDLRFYYVLYRLFSSVELQLEKYMPEYTFNTAKYKSNGKNYCNHLPENFRMLDWYNWLSGGDELDMNSTVCKLTRSHPSDPSGAHKWNITQRYVSLNFINALFYNRNKTVEFRFLKPSYNVNFIINWIYLFTAILKTAEMIYNVNDLKKKTFSECDDLCHVFFSRHIFDICTCINNAYSNDFKTKEILFEFLKNLAIVTKLQKFVGDKIGLKTQFHDIYFKNNPIDKQES